MTHVVETRTAPSTARTPSSRPRLYGGGDETQNGPGPATTYTAETQRLHGETEYGKGKEAGKKEGDPKHLTHGIGYTSAVIAAMLIGTSLGIWHENATKGKQIKALQQQLQQSAN